MNYSLLAFLFFFFFLYGITSFYLGKRVYDNIDYAYTINKRKYWIIFSFLSLSYILARIADPWLPYQAAKFLVMTSSYWIVFYFYGLLFFLFFDFVNFADKKIDFLPQTIKYEKDNRVLITFLTIIIIFFLAIYGTFQAQNIQVVTYEVTTEKELSRDYKIALISDVHISYQIGANRFAEIINKTNALQPDFILIAGDFFDGDWRTFYEEEINYLLKDFESEFGMYMVLGNHDNFLQNRDIIKPLFAESGITVLKDESVLINNEFILVGRKDITEDRIRYGSESRVDLEDLLRNINNQKVIVLMDHSPLDIYHAERLGVDLQVAGHTHNGQMYPFGIITERYYAFDYGHLIRDAYHLIVTSGTGTWGPPVRIGTKSEIVLIDLKQEKNNH